ncbi:ribonuclease P protein component [Parapedomonas caeni]
MRLEKLLKRRDYLAANSGRRWSTPGFVLLAHPRLDDRDSSRVGFTVTKRVGNAVVRNRLKRRLRALAREALAPEARPGIDYVFIGRGGGLDRDWTDLLADLKRGLGKLHRT